MVYRVNYGNGQVSRTFHGLRAAREFARLTEAGAFGYVEWRDMETGDWFPVRRK